MLHTAEYRKAGIENRVLRFSTLNPGVGADHEPVAAFASVHVGFPARRLKSVVPAPAAQGGIAFAIGRLAAIADQIIVKRGARDRVGVTGTQTHVGPRGVQRSPVVIIAHRLVGCIA